MPTFYTVFRCKSANDDSRKPGTHTHYADDAESTLCGKVLDENWFIETNCFDGIATCLKCIKIESKTSLVQRSRLKQKTKQTRKTK